MIRITLALLLPCSLSSTPAAAQEKAEVETPKAPSRLTPRLDPEAFVAWLKQSKAPRAVIESFRSEWSAGPDARITDRALRKVVPAYAAAMNLVGKGEPRGVLELAKLLGETEDAWVRAHARYYLARALLDEDDPEGAAELLARFIRQDRGRSMLDPEAAFYLGYSLSLIPAVQEAILNLEAFLRIYPNAGERYRSNAADLIVELRSQWDSPLHQIADDMKYCERKLRKDKTGKHVETKQLDIIEKLTRLIEELEKQKKGGGGGPPSGNQVPNGPASESALPGGEGRVGSLHGSRGVKDKWGDMKDRDRQKILNEVQAKLPDHLRALIEKYYKRVNK